MLWEWFFPYLSIFWVCLPTKLASFWGKSMFHKILSVFEIPTGSARPKFLSESSRRVKTFLRKILRLCIQVCGWISVESFSKCWSSVREAWPPKTAFLGTVPPLDGGFKHLLFSPLIWGNDPSWLIIYVSNGLVQPPTSPFFCTWNFWWTGKKDVNDHLFCRFSCRSCRGLRAGFPPQPLKLPLWRPDLLRLWGEHPTDLHVKKGVFFLNPGSRCHQLKNGDFC